MIVIDFQEMPTGETTSIKPVIRFVGDNSRSLSELTMITYMLQTGMYGPAMYQAMLPHLSKEDLNRLSHGLTKMLKAAENEPDSTDELEAAKIPVIPPNQQKNESNS